MCLKFLNISSFERMENNQETPNSKSLQELPYSELKKLAKKHGIKGNMKAEKIISTLNSLNSSGIETFSTPAQTIINSSKKNKEAKFDDDQATPMATPRRGTYSLETPSSLKVDEISLVATDTSLLDMSNVTLNRGSERKLRPRKVSFMSPVKTPSTPKNSNLRLRPKTPVAHHTSVGKRVSFSTPAQKAKKKSTERPLPTTPLPKLSFSEENSGFSRRSSEISFATPLPCIKEASGNEDTAGAIKKADNATEKTADTVEETKDATSRELPEKDENKPVSLKPVVTKNEAFVKMKKNATPGSVKSFSSKKVAFSKNKLAATPGSAKSAIPKSDASSKIKRAATPNFKKIHEKAFKKMESIDDYQKRKVMDSAKKIGMRPDFKSKVTKAKSKIPFFSGVPFVPSLSGSKVIRPFQDDKKQKPDKCPDTAKVIEAAPKSSKRKFDLKASLSRKLGYKPYSGPLKPLAERNNLNISIPACGRNVKEPVNTVVASKRMETRSLIRGVRTNKRFELQMRNRQLE